MTEKSIRQLITEVEERGTPAIKLDPSAEIRNIKGIIASIDPRLIVESGSSEVVLDGSEYIPVNIYIRTDDSKRELVTLPLASRLAIGGKVSGMAQASFSREEIESEIRKALSAK